MKKIIFLTVIMILAIASVSWAAPATGPRINYGGYVAKDTQGLVTADTLIVLFNPNNVGVSNVGIAVYDKGGIQVNGGSEKLLNHTGDCPNPMPAKGWCWQTIGNLIPTPVVPPSPPASKYTFFVYWTKPTTTPYRAMVIEIKELIYTIPVYPTEGPWLPAFIKFWSEAALGASAVRAQ
jgi:hypothetical protein